MGHINTIQTKEEIIDSTINQKNKVLKNKKNNDIQQASNQNYHDENPMNISKGKIKNVNYTINHSKYSSKSCKIDQKQAVHRDVSLSQIYITLNDNPSFTNNLTSAMSLKYKKIKMNNPANPGNTGNTTHIPKKTNVNKQGIG